MRLYRFILFVVATGVLFSCSKSNKSTPATTTTTTTTTKDSAYDFSVTQPWIMGLNLSFKCNRNTSKEYWDFGDGGFRVWTPDSGAHEIGHIYRYPGMYAVTLIVNDDSAHAIKRHLEISPDYYLDYSGMLTVDSPIRFHFNHVSTQVNSYRWDFGDGTSSSDSTPVHTYSISGGFMVTLKVNNNDSLKISRFFTVNRFFGDISKIATPRKWQGSKKFWYVENGHCNEINSSFSDTSFALVCADSVTLVFWGGSLGGDANYRYDHDRSDPMHLYYAKDYGSSDDYIYYDHSKDSVSIHTKWDANGAGGSSITSDGVYYDFHTH